ncbi:MAG: hypothetical protein Q9225_000497 [Loekoesia sp. 1 TL-2023]
MHRKSSSGSATNSSPCVIEMLRAPQITLDTTLGQLYAQDGPGERKTHMAVVFGFASSEIALSCKVVENKKYLYQDRTFTATPSCFSSQNREAVQRDAAIKYLSLTPQRDAFAAGNMPVIIFNLDSSGKLAAHSKEEAEKTISSLDIFQRPMIDFCDGPDQISMENAIDVLVTKTVVDGLERLPLAIDPNTLYFLNSKAALCTSGLPR